MRMRLAVLFLAISASGLGAGLDPVFVSGKSAAVSTLSGFVSGDSKFLWKVIRDRNDERGNRHVFYQQWTCAKSGACAPVQGADVGLHYTPEGVLRFIGGYQATDLAITNGIGFQVSQALDIAYNSLSFIPAFTPEAWSVVQPEFKADRLTRVRLVIVPHDDHTAVFAYEVPVRDANDIGYTALVDATTEEIISLDEDSNSGNCSVTTPVALASVTGTPERLDLRGIGVTRSLNANTFLPARNGYTYEGFRWSTGSSPAIWVFHYTTDSAFRCSTNDYTLFPVTTNSGFAAYNDTAPPWVGTAAGDAMYKTMKTMTTLSGMGWSSWNGSGGDAKIVVRILGQGWPDQAKFERSATSNGPANSVLVGTSDKTAYPETAALDLIGHEWGHGVIYSSANFSGNLDSDGLSEGWANFIGVLAEKKSEPTGTGAELSSDWKTGEDVLSTTTLTSISSTNYLHAGDTDDGPAGHLWGSSSQQDYLHADDEPTNHTGHKRGAMMLVVYKILTAGGRNAYCSGHASSVGCETGFNPTGMGITKSSKVLFETLVNYLPSNVNWTQVADYAKQAAFSIYANCSLNHSALVEQNSVDDAFRSVGYPSTLPNESCTP